MAARKVGTLGADGHPQLLQVGDVIAIPAFIVARLPALGSPDRALAFATDGRALNTTASLLNLSFEAAGAGTGCLVSWNGQAWKVVGTNSTVAA